MLSRLQTIELEKLLYTILFTSLSACTVGCMDMLGLLGLLCLRQFSGVQVAGMEELCCFVQKLSSTARFLPCPPERTSKIRELKLSYSSIWHFLPTMLKSSLQITHHSSTLGKPAIRATVHWIPGT